MKRGPYLTAPFVRRVKQPGTYGDGRGGGGLQLRVHKMSNGMVSKNWRQVIRIGGKVASLGLGSWPHVTLAAARLKAWEHKSVISRGGDPRNAAAPMVPAIAHASPEVGAPQPEPTGPNFQEAAEKVIALNAPSWKPGGGTEQRWWRDLKGHAFPVFGDKHVSRVEAADVLAVVTPVWHSKPEVARSVLNKTGQILEWAIGNGYRTDDPTSAVKAALPKQRRKTKHYAAVPHTEAPDVFARIQACRKGMKMAREALQFHALTAARPGEVLTLQWSDVDLDARLWTVPPEKTKRARPHLVPLSDAAMAVLRRVRPTGRLYPSAYVFPNTKRRAMDRKRLGKIMAECAPGYTSHGWRSCFRDWCGDTGVDWATAEHALNHQVGNATERSYYRTTLLEQRASVMQQYGQYLTGIS